MIEVIETLNFYLALGGVASFLFALFLTIDLKRERAFTSLIQKYGLYLALLTSLSGTFSALLYSEYFGFVPCGFCWLARILLFPQIILLLVALYYKDVLVARYGLALSLTGIVITLYHHYLQMGGSGFVRCLTAGDSDCSQRFMFEFGFMTFPLLATAGFVLLSALYYYMLKTR